MAIPFVGIVLTGGSSSRMGRDKSLLTLNGAALATHVARALRDAGADEVLAVGGDLDRLRSLGSFDRVLPDLHPGEGPLGGLITAFEEANGRVMVVLACDTPAITPETPLRLLDALGTHPQAAVAVAIRNGRRQPLTAAWRPERCIEVLRSAFAAGERAPRSMFDAIVTHDVEDIPASGIDDVDRPIDLDRYAADATAANERGHTVSAVPEIDLGTLEGLLASGVVLVDVREDDEYSDGHVAGAIPIPLATIPERFDEIDAAGPVYVICALGGRSTKAAQFLRGQGIDAINVAGGTQGWIDSGRAVVRGTSPV